MPSSSNKKRGMTYYHRAEGTCCLLPLQFKCLGTTCLKLTLH